MNRYNQESRNPSGRGSPRHSNNQDRRTSGAKEGGERRRSGPFRRFEKGRVGPKPFTDRPQATFGNNQTQNTHHTPSQKEIYASKVLTEFKAIPAESLADFSSFNFPELIMKALNHMEFTQPTPVQSYAIPEVLAGKDLIACAQTGTGKTAAFALPILKYFIENPEKRALILAPTRELAQQIGDFWRNLCTLNPEFRSVTVTGGSPMDRQIKALMRKPNLIVATPGRLLDHLKRKRIQTDNIAVLVLDEADRMLDMGFAPQLEEIEKRLPKQRQNLLFSATWNKEVDKLASYFLRSPVKLSVGGVSKAANQIEQKFKYTNIAKKNVDLVNELKARKGSVIIFTRTKARTHKLATYLQGLGWSAEQMHGGRTQGQRRAALNAFKNGEINILVATDVASRGIDVADISHVINYDLPMVPEDYIHRIGRSGRAGLTGKALSFVTPEENRHWGEILKLLKKTGSLMPQQ